MPIPEHHREERKALTREAAVALVDDLKHIREVVKRPNPSPSELRRLSVILRRLVVENDLGNVAAPRIGRIELNVRDNEPVIRSNNEKSFAFFQSAGVTIFGLEFHGCAIEQGARKPRIIQGFNPSRIVKVRRDGFLNQPVLCLDGEMATRKQVIEYVANVASGAHSKTPGSITSNKKNTFDRLTRLRHVVSYCIKDNKPQIIMNVEAISVATLPFKYTPDAIDPVLLELLASAHYLITSDDVGKLEAMIRDELKGYA